MQTTCRVLALFSMATFWSCKVAQPTGSFVKDNPATPGSGPALTGAPPLCVAWPPFAGDAGTYPKACAVGANGGSETIAVKCHAHVGREVFPDPAGGPELHCIEQGAPPKYTPPRVFGAPFQWALLCPDQAAAQPGSPPSDSSAPPSDQSGQAGQPDATALSLTGGAASVAGQVVLAAESDPCCAGPLTGKQDPEAYNCTGNATNCVTFMLSASASPVDAMMASASDPLRLALCAKYKEEGGAGAGENENSATHRGMLYTNSSRCLNPAKGALNKDAVEHGSCLTAANPSPGGAAAPVPAQAPGVDQAPTSN